MYSVNMERMQITFVVLNLISVATCVLGEAVAFFPPEARAANQFQYIHPYQQFQPVNRNALSQGFVYSPESIYRQAPMFIDDEMMPQERMASEELVDPKELVQPILHTAAVPPQVPQKPLTSINFTGTPQMSENVAFRVAKGNYDYPSHNSASYPPASSYGYSPGSSSYTPPAQTSGYTPPAPASHYTSPATAPAQPSYPPPAPAHHPPENKFSLLKPDLTSLIKPVTTKVATKISGLLSLVLSLFGSGSEELQGFKDIVINGILKPLLIAKGGIKSLISKLTIPLISLLLINLEVLITVWWLWEECPEVKPTYEYTKPPSYAPSATSYNSYR